MFAAPRVLYVSDYGGAYDVWEERGRCGKLYCGVGGGCGSRLFRGGGEGFARWFVDVWARLGSFFPSGEREYRVGGEGSFGVEQPAPGQALEFSLVIVHIGSEKRDFMGE